MKRSQATAMTLLAIFLLPVATSAKGATVRITIQGDGLAAPIEISDPIVRNFEVWSGPGTYSNGVEGTEGFIIDWARGVVANRPDGLRRYEVAFYAERAQAVTRVYVVSYELDPSTGPGYVCLPGKGDEWYRLNVSAIYRGAGLNGHCFGATRAWEKFIRPILRKSIASTPSHASGGP